MGAIYDTKTATVVTGATGISNAVDLGASSLVAILMPATWVAAVITLSGSFDGTTFKDVYDSTGVEVSIVAVQNHLVLVPGVDLQGVRYLKFRSGLSAAIVDQTTSRILTLLTRQLRTQR